MNARLSTVALALFALGCGAGEPPAAEFTDPSTAYWIQTREGLFDQQGRWLASLPGGTASTVPGQPKHVVVPDPVAMKVVPVSSERLFLATREPEWGVWELARSRDRWRAVRRQAGWFSHVFGRSAVVEQHTQLRPGLVVDRTNLLRHGGETQEIPNDTIDSLWPDRAEYWWERDGDDKPRAVIRWFAKEEPRYRVGFLGTEGQWLVEPHVQGNLDHGRHEMIDGVAYVGVDAHPDGGPGWIDRQGRWLGVPLPEGEMLASHWRSEDKVFVLRPADTGVKWPLSLRSTGGELLGTLPADVLIPTEIGGTALRNAADRKVTSIQYRFHEGRALVHYPSRAGTWTFGYVDEHGQESTPRYRCDLDLVAAPFHDQRAFVCEGDSLWMIDPSGAKVAGPWRTDFGVRSHPLYHHDGDEKHPHAPIFSEGYAYVPVEGGWSYVDTAGKVVLKGPFAWAAPVRLGIAWVSQGDPPVSQFMWMDGRPALVPPAEASP